jgi:hypothetical protein
MNKINKKSSLAPLFGNVINSLSEKSNLKLIIVGLVTVIILGIFIYNLSDNSFTNIFNYIFTTIHCDEKAEYKDFLIIIQSFHDSLVVPVDGYDIVNEDVFLDMYDNQSGKIGFIEYGKNKKGMYFIEVNKKVHTVHPYLVDIIFERFGINK